MAIFIKHTGCPRCGSSDACAHYSDGSTFCFSCGVPSGATHPDFKRSFVQQEDDEEETIVLPPNLSHDFPQEVVDWIKPTTVTIQELLSHGYLFSHSTSELVRPFYRGDHWDLERGSGPRLVAYEARRLFNTWNTRRGPKNVFKGQKAAVSAYSFQGRPLQPPSPRSSQEDASVGQGQEAYRDLCSDGRSQLVIVEDSLSSIRVGRAVPSVPLFGSSVNKDRLVKLIEPFSEIIVWLDSDKLHSARTICEQVRMLGKKSSVVFTELDPKYCNVEEIL